MCVFLCVDLHRVHAVPLEARSRHQIPWCWSYRCLWAAMLVLEMEPLWEQQTLSNAEFSLLLHPLGFWLVHTTAYWQKWSQWSFFSTFSVKITGPSQFWGWLVRCSAMPWLCMVVSLGFPVSLAFVSDHRIYCNPMYHDISWSQHKAEGKVRFFSSSGSWYYFFKPGRSVFPRNTQQTLPHDLDLQPKRFLSCSGCSTLCLQWGIIVLGIGMNSFSCKRSPYRCLRLHGSCLIFVSRVLVNLTQSRGTWAEGI